MIDDDEPIASGVLPIGLRSGHMLAADDVTARFARLFQVAAALGGTEFAATIEAALDYASLPPEEREAFIGHVVDDLPGDELCLCLQNGGAAAFLDELDLYARGLGRHIRLLAPIEVALFHVSDRRLRGRAALPRVKTPSA